MGRRRALLVATYEYEDSGLRRLTTPARDAEALAAVLGDREIAGFDVQTLINEPTQRVGEAIAEFYAASERDDLTLLYFTGHGLKDDNGRLHLAMANTRRDNLRFTALSAQLVDEVLEESPSRQKILILDCCYSGAYATQQYAKADAAVHTKEVLGGRGRTVLTASDSTQYAFEGAEIVGSAAQSVFTRHLVDGLRTGAADGDSDGDITVDELYDYAYRQVVAEQPNQRPRKFAEVEGDTVIATNVHWSLPEAIGGLLANPVPAVRQTAIEWLALLLGANNERVRRTARARLEALRGDDSRAIATAAEAVLAAPDSASGRGRVGPPVPPGVQLTIHAGEPTSGAPELSVLSALRATVQRQRPLIRRPEVVWPVFLPSIVAAAAATWAASSSSAETFGGGPRLGGVHVYLVAVAVLFWSSLVVQLWRPANAATFSAGLVGPGVLSTAVVIGWMTQPDLLFLIFKEEALLRIVILLGQVAWLSAGVVGLVVVLRSGGFTGRRALARPGLALLLTGSAAALLMLVILAFRYQDFPGTRSLFPAALIILAAEAAVAGPLLVGSFNQRRAFLAAWILGGFAVWFSLFRLSLGSPGEIAESALYALWLVLGVLAIRWATRSVSDRAGSRRTTVAALVAPVVLGAAVAVVAPPGLLPTQVLAVAISPGGEFLIEADSLNDRLLKVSTNTRQQVGEALPLAGDPDRLLMAPTGDRLYVLDASGDLITKIDPVDWKALGEPVKVAPHPTAMALSPGGDTLYALSPEARTITVVDTTTMTVSRGPVSTDADPADLAVEGSRVFVAYPKVNSVGVLDAETFAPVRSPIDVKLPAAELEMASDGFLYAVGESSYAVVNTKVESPRPTARSLGGPAKSPVVTGDGKRLFVLGRASAVAGAKDVVNVVETSNHTKEAVELSSRPGFAISLVASGDGQRIYVLTVDRQIVIVDGAGLTPIGSIAIER
jgi:uncharacterized caspase-like protein/DNA-binding beta-propeller fold protein YncE